MPERIPAAYPNMGTNQINFSLPLRLAHHRSMSSLSSRSRSSTSVSGRLEVPHSVRSRAASVPTSPACESTHGPHNHLPNLHANGPTSNPNLSRRPRPQLNLADYPRIRADSTSSVTSSLEASLAELEELIETLSTPAPYIESFFESQPKDEPNSKTARPPGSPRVVPENVRRCPQAGPRWI